MADGGNLLISDSPTERQTTAYKTLKRSSQNS